MDPKSERRINRTIGELPLKFCGSQFRIPLPSLASATLDLKKRQQIPRGKLYNQITVSEDRQVASSARHAGHFGNPRFDECGRTDVAINLLSGLLGPLDQGAKSFRR